MPPPQPLVSRYLGKLYVQHFDIIFEKFREQSPYQRSAIKLSSFSENKGSGIYGTSGIGSGNNVQWGGAQRAAPGQPGQLLWNPPGATNGHNKVILSI